MEQNVNIECYCSNNMLIFKCNEDVPIYILKKTKFINYNYISI